MLYVISIIVVFSIVVIVHELGHFLAAKWMGVRVEKFSIGFPPTIYSKKIGDTEFCLSAIPLGGFIKMSGFIDESMDTSATGADYEFNSKPIWRRVIIITGGVVMNFILAVAILAALNFYQGEKIIPVTTIGFIGQGGVAEKIGFNKYDEILAVNNDPVNNWNEIQINFLNNLNKDVLFTVLRDNKKIELYYKKEWFKTEKGEQLDIVPLFSSKVGDVSPGMPAGKLGLQRGDEIISLAGSPVKDWLGMTEAIRAHPDEQISLRWRRGSEILSGTIIPQKFEEQNEQGEMENIGKIGIGYYYEHIEIGLLPAIGKGFVNTCDLIVLNMRGLWWVISGTKSAKEIIGGPIMIAKMAGDAVQAGLTYFWYLIAALSAVLAFINILPIPALDGGHLFFLILEGFMGKPLPVKTRIKFQQIGMALLLTLIVFVVYVDISRLLF